MSLLQQSHVLARRHHHGLNLQCAISFSGFIHECDKYGYRFVRNTIVNGWRLLLSMKKGVVWLQDGNMVWRE